jgi:antirestriction protein ArdC
MNEKVKQILEKILASFESGDVPAALSVAVLPRLDVPCSKWSLCNRLICFFADTSDARGFRQWKEVGRFPKKGSKAIYILSPKHRKVKDEENEEEKQILTGFVAVPVFRQEDTDGKPLEKPTLRPKELPPLIEVAEKWGISVNWQSYQGDGYGFFRPSTKEIVLATHDESVFFHEIAHTAHERVNGKLKPGQDWKQEVVAELTAAVLAHLYGKRTNDGACYRYIRSYVEKAGKDVYRACLSVIADVGKCLEEIMQEREVPEAITA